MKTHSQIGCLKMVDQQSLMSVGNLLRVSTYIVDLGIEDFAKMSSTCCVPKLAVVPTDLSPPRPALTQPTSAPIGITELPRGPLASFNDRRLISSQAGYLNMHHFKPNANVPFR